MAANTLRSKQLGYHIRPTNDLLLARLRAEVQQLTDVNRECKFPIIDLDLYYTEPWNVLKDDDPWEINNHQEKSVTRMIYVFTKLKIDAGRSRASRMAGKGSWSGSTGEQKVEGERPGSVIGTKSSFEFKIQKDEEGKIIVPGHWSMHEYKLYGESYNGLESIPLAKNLVLCQIIHVIDKAQGIHLSWPKTPFKMCFDKFKEWGFFLKKRKEPPADEYQQVQEEELQNRNKKQKTEEGPTSSAPTMVDDMLVERDDDIPQENQVVLYGHKGGIKYQSCRAVNQNPNVGEWNSEFAQRQELVLVNSKEGNQNNLMSAADSTPCSSSNYASDDGNPYYHQIGGLLSNALSLSNSHMMVSETESLGMGSTTQAPQLDPFDVDNMAVKRDNEVDNMVVKRDDEVEGWWSEIEDLGMENQPQLDPFDVQYSLSYWGIEQENESVDLMGINQMMSSGETPFRFYSAPDGYYNEPVWKEKLVAFEGTDGQLLEHQNSRDVDQSLVVDEKQQQYGVTSSNENNKLVEVNGPEDEQGPSVGFNYEEFVEKMKGEYTRYLGLDKEEQKKYGLMSEDDNVLIDVERQDHEMLCTLVKSK